MRVRRQRATAGGQYPLDGGFAEHTVEQVLAGQTTGAENKQVAGTVGVRHGLLVLLVMLARAGRALMSLDQHGQSAVVKSTQV
ncbi:hypothetical protein D3C72_2131090 [compost metagenome]